MALVYGLHRISDRTIRYIGMTTKTVERRFYEHRHSADSGKDLPVYRWMRKHEDVVVTVLIDKLTKEQAIFEEIRLIKSYNRLLNCTSGGEGLIDPSLETRQKMSAQKKGIAPTKKAIEAARKANTGRKIPQDVIEKRRQSLIGRSLSEETRLKISRATKGRKAHNKGMQPTEATRQKMSSAQLLREKISCPHCNRICDPGNAKRWHFDKCQIRQEFTYPLGLSPQSQPK